VQYEGLYYAYDNIIYDAKNFFDSELDTRIAKPLKDIDLRRSVLLLMNFTTEIHSLLPMQRYSCYFSNKHSIVVSVYQMLSLQKSMDIQ
jgi:hypothetical protein